MNVLELYSGIGGMHLALNESGVNGKIVTAVEINPVANSIYRHNFPETKLLEANIEGITAEDIKKLGVNTILMSPPCQPFTRNGLKKDIDDPRTASFVHLLELLPQLHIENMLVENVKGFETSQMRDILIKVLADCGFDYQEFVLSPNQFGVPNSRTRYYCLARKHIFKFPFERRDLLEFLPETINYETCFPISKMLEPEVDIKYYLTDTMLQKRFNIIDICTAESTRSCCFTKAYGRYFEGTGSILSERRIDTVEDVYRQIDSNSSPEDTLNLMKSLNLRFFTPREICRLMCFPQNFSFPNSVSDSKKYNVLGNSINVKVVSSLIKFLDS